MGSDSPDGTSSAKVSKSSSKKTRKTGSSVGESKADSSTHHSKSEKRRHKSSGSKSKGDQPISEGAHESSDPEANKGLEIVPVVKAVKVLVLFYSTYGHVAELARSAAKGVQSAGAVVDIKQVPELLSDEVLQKKGALGLKDTSIPVIENADHLLEYDGFIFGFPSHYGVMSAQFKAFWDSTGSLWAKRKLVGKFVTTFVSTASLHGGQETTHLSSYSLWAHHGMIIVPTGFMEGYPMDVNESSGCSAYGSSTIAASDGSRRPHQREIDYAFNQAIHFTKVVKCYAAGAALDEK